LHNGQLVLDSARGMGTHARVFLARATIEAADAPQASALAG
jgi:hypothetical protein